MSSPRHVPVLLDRVVALLAPALEREGAVLIDATLGLGGHSEAVLTRIPQARVIGVDHVDAVLFDLGVSSMQLDVRERGFAYAEDAPLDMRMDKTTGRTAADVLNTYSAPDLTRVLREYGEEKFARKIATAIVREREGEP